jgi:hypothetical protein
MQTYSGRIDGDDLDGNWGILEYWVSMLTTRSVTFKGKSKISLTLLVCSVTGVAHRLPLYQFLKKIGTPETYCLEGYDAIQSIFLILFNDALSGVVRVKCTAIPVTGRRGS